MPSCHVSAGHLLLLSLLLLAAGCATPATDPPGLPLPAPTADAAQGDNVQPQPPAAPPAEVGIFTRAQAERGRVAFEESCADCHTTGEFRGRTFQNSWGRRTVYSLFRTVRSTMPDDNPGGLAEQAYLDVTSYILRLNGHEPGAREMVADSPMREVRIAVEGEGR